MGSWNHPGRSQENANCLWTLVDWLGFDLPHFEHFLHSRVRSGLARPEIEGCPSPVFRGFSLSARNRFYVGDPKKSENVDAKLPSTTVRHCLHRRMALRCTTLRSVPKKHCKEPTKGYPVPTATGQNVTQVIRDIHLQF